MKKIGLLLFTLLITTVGFSQNSAKAKKLLDKAAEQVKSYKNIYIEFNHRIDNNDANVHQETMGNVTLKGDLYHLNYMGTEQIFDGKKVYLIVNEDEEVIIQKPAKDNDDDEGGLTPSKMFSFYKKGYTYSMGDLKTIKGIKIQFVKLTPIDSNSDVADVLVGIDVKTNHIYTIIENGKNKTSTTIEVRTFKTNQPISDSLFTFDLAKYRDQKKYTITEPK